MRTSAKLLLYFLPLLSVAHARPLATLAAQQPTDEAVPRADELRVVYFVPQHCSLNALFDEVQQALPVWLRVRKIDVPGQAVEVVQRRVFEVVGDALLVRGTPEQLESILETLRTLDRALARPEDLQRATAKDPKLVELEYAVRFVDPRTLDLALERFKGPIRLELASGGFVQVPNVTTLAERGLILVKDSAERVAEIRTFLERLDTPAPQVTISYLVLQAAAEADPSGPAVPGALTDNLKKLVPFAHFRTLSSGVLRGSSRATMQVQVDDASQGAPSIRLELDPASFDPGSKTLTLRRCFFQLAAAESQRSLETAASLRAGEYTVIGAAGSDLVFLVLRLTLE